MKACKICKLVKEITEFNPASKYKDKIYYRSECKSCNLLKQSSDQTAQIKYRNSEKGAIKKKEYKQSEKYKEYQKEYDRLNQQKPEVKLRKYTYIKNRLKADPLYRMRFNMRNRIRGAFKSKSWRKDNTTAIILGCSFDELKNHIQNQFINEMTWDNYGEWEIDHIIPLSSAKTEQEMYKLCHYLNLQPLWRYDNIKKSNKI